ncbi:MAG: UbiX family flavin prenyltransferase [Euryarchaeota archaeon]|nr:UbiX family flavin prenyltransferase [Euryarchaeota archaeon]
MKIVVGLTGASGMPYALALLKILRKKGVKVTLISSNTGRRVAAEELDGGAASLERLAGEVLENCDMGAWPASGSNDFDGMIVIPCTTSTLSKIAYGIGDTLITRTAAVALKERRKLVLVPRETPLSLPMIEAMRAATLAGAVVLPAMPGFYHRPKEVSELVDFVAERCASALGVKVKEGVRWKAKKGSTQNP